MDDSNYSLWKATRKIKRPQAAFPPIRTSDGQWARNESEKADTFAEHLSKVCTPYPREITPKEEDVIHRIIESPFKMDLPIKKFKVTEVRKTILMDLNPNKAPGYDLITGKVLKQLPEEGFRMFTIIFNAILRLSHYPSQWKAGQIILILKPGKDSSEVSSYRPISLWRRSYKV